MPFLSSGNSPGPRNEDLTQDAIITFFYGTVISPRCEHITHTRPMSSFPWIFSNLVRRHASWILEPQKYLLSDMFIARLSMHRIGKLHPLWERIKLIWKKKKGGDKNFGKSLNAVTLQVPVFTS